MKKSLGMLMLSTALLLVVSPVFAETPNTPTSGSSVAIVTKKVCMANAKDIYTAAVKAATDTAKAANLTAKDIKNTALKDAGVNTSAGSTAIKAARTAYQVALKNAVAITDKTARAQAIKIAATTYKAALKDAGVSTGAGSTAIKAANATYKTTIVANAKAKATAIKTASSDYTTALKACPKK